MVDKEMKIFALRQQEMKDYIVMKERKAADMKLREIQRVMAIKLQSWWRGEMVRQFRGPYQIYQKRAFYVKDALRLGKTTDAKKKKKK